LVYFIGTAFYWLSLWNTCICRQQMAAENSCKSTGSRELTPLPASAELCPITVSILVSEISKGESWSGRACCPLPQSEKCQHACVTAAKRQDLVQSCRQSDELAFFTCLDRQEVSRSLQPPCEYTGPSPKRAIGWLFCRQLMRPKSLHRLPRTALGWYAARYRHVRAFVKVNLFKRFVVTVDAEHVSLLLLNHSVFTNIGPAIRIAVTAHHTPIFW
jgi:hypothetical protein